jgi:dienelactone hydrolase
MKRLLFVGLLLVSVAAFGAERSFPAGASAEEFAKWQTQTRALLATILFNGPAQQAVALDPVYGKTEPRERYTLTEVTFHDRPGHVTHGWLARPVHPLAPRLPAMLSLHGHGFDALATFNPKNMYCYGDLFANQGYVVLALDIGHDFVEHDKPYEGYGPLPRDEKFPATGQKVWMVMKGVDFLQTLPDVDPEMIGAVGLSNGGFITTFSAAMDPRIKAAVAAGSLIMHDRMWHRELLHCRCQYLPRLDGVLDYYDVAALIAPRPIMFQSGRRDPIFPIHSAQKAFKFVKQAYTIAGAPDHAYHDIHDGKHEFRKEMPEKWFAEYLPLPGQ